MPKAVPLHRRLLLLQGRPSRACSCLITVVPLHSSLCRASLSCCAAHLPTVLDNLAPGIFLQLRLLGTEEGAMEQKFLMGAGGTGCEVLVRNDERVVGTTCAHQTRSSELSSVLQSRLRSAVTECLFQHLRLSRSRGACMLAYCSLDKG